MSNLLHRMDALFLREVDIEESYHRPSGKRSLIGVNLLHKPTGIRVRCDRENSQGINRFVARRSLVEELEARLQNKTRHEVKAEKLRQEKQRRKGSRKRTQSLTVFGIPAAVVAADSAAATAPGSAPRENAGAPPPRSGAAPTRPSSRPPAPPARKGFDLAQAERGFILRMPYTGLPSVS